MKLLTRLRELRDQNSIDALFDNFHYAPENYRAESLRTDSLGIGSVFNEDIARLGVNKPLLALETRNAKQA